MSPGGEVERPDSGRCPDWKALRQQSLEPGGFRESRVHIWPQLLRVDPVRSNPETSHTDSVNTPPEEIHDTRNTAEAVPLEAHRDERQILLDTERSFVLYPVEDITESKEALQSELYELLLAIFRKRPILCYFQGYHDIITVIFMTLPPEMQLVCAEKLSLQVVRDSMTSTLEPVLGLLRVLRNVLRLADPSFASLLERTSPLPYYALSNLLTLFSHDMPTLSLIQHVFDYLLCRPPIVVVYLAAALILSRRPEVERLEKEGEEGMVHSLLSGMPDISDEVPQDVLSNKQLTGSISSLDGSESKATYQPNAALDDDTYEHLDDGEPKHETRSPTIPVFASQIGDVKAENNSSESPPPDDHPTSASLPDTSTPAELGDDVPLSGLKAEGEKGDTPCLSPSSRRQRRRANLSLTSLLIRADELYSTYPPTHPAVALPSIMGPQSVMFTWSEHLSEMPNDDEAELMVQQKDLVVRPYVDTDADDKESEDKRRKLRRSPRFAGVTLERRTIVAGVVIVGVGVAVWGIRARSLGPLSSIGEGYGRDHIWRRVGAWVGGALAAGSEHVINVG